MSTFKHADCGGELILDVAAMFSFRTPSLSISPEGITVGVLELESRRTKNALPTFCCAKCSENIALKDFKEIETMCLVCRGYKSVGISYISRELSCICSDCKKALENPRSAGISESVKRVLTYINTPTRGFSFVKFTDVLEMKLKF